MAELSYALKWRALDPVFVLGMQRSGTSVLAQALLQTGFRAFAEGHLWLDLVRPFQALLDPCDRAHLRHPDYTLGGDRAEALLKYVAVAIDQFHRDHLELGTGRWLDKSPGVYAVRNAPTLAAMFPAAQFVFTSRNGVDTVHSGKHRWPEVRGNFEGMCRGWTETMSSWRSVRRALGSRALEIAQEDLAAHPHETAADLCRFVGRVEKSEAMGSFFELQRLQSSFPDKPPGDYSYSIDWTPVEVRLFTEICAEEMREWGYSWKLEDPT